MNREQRKRKIKRATAHKLEQRVRKDDAIERATAAAKKAKKGKAGIKAQMEKLGYLPDGKGGWRPMHRQEREMREPKTTRKRELAQ